MSPIYDYIIPPAFVQTLYVSLYVGLYTESIKDTIFGQGLPYLVL